MGLSGIHMNNKLIGLGFLIALSGCQNDQSADVSPSSLSTNTSCERECLEAHIENYLQALAAQNISLISVTDDLVFSENNQLLELGDGSWQTMTGTGSYRHYFADPQTNQVAVISTMRENGEGIIYDLRLKLEGDQISEIESMVIRTPSGAALYEELGTPPENFLQSIPEEQRNTREELLAIPYQYLKGMENNIPNRGYPFFDIDCNRIEHALKTTNSEPINVGHTTSTVFSTMTCEEQFNTGGLGFVTRIRDERYNETMVVDEERQSIFGFVFLDHNGTIRSITKGDGVAYTIPAYFSTPRSLMVGEAWRVRDHKLLEIEMTLTEALYGMRPQFGLNEANSDWLISNNVNTSDIRIDSDCDQRCLNTVTNSFVNALITHDYSNLPLSPNVIYHENGQKLAIGDGLWGTATERNDYQIFLSNPESGETGFFGSITETDISSLLSARLQISEGLIQNIDVTVMRHEFTGERGGNLSLFEPQLDSMYNPENFEEIEHTLNQPGNSSLVSLISQANAAVSDSRSNAILVADAANGLVLQLSINDVTNASSEQRDPLLSGSFSVLTTTLYKFSGDELILTKSVSRPMPYKMPL